MRFLLRPSWIALFVAVIAFVVACYALLAPWQFAREEHREAQQAAIDAATATAPVAIDELVRTGQGVRPDLQWRQVTVTGTYLPQAQAIARLRTVDSAPAVEVLTPLRTTDGRLLLVDRGSAPSSNGAVVPQIPAPPTGEVTITARLRLDETDPDARPAFVDSGVRQVYAVNAATVGAATGLVIEPGYLLLAADQPGVLRPITVAPPTSVAPFTNLSYALQWLTFGAIALFALAYFVRLELLQRRKNGTSGTSRTDLRKALAGDADPGWPDDPASHPNETPLNETPLNRRYG